MQKLLKDGSVPVDGMIVKVLEGRALGNLAGAITSITEANCLGDILVKCACVGHVGNTFFELTNDLARATDEEIVAWAEGRSI